MFILLSFLPFLPLRMRRRLRDIPLITFKVLYVYTIYRKMSHFSIGGFMFGLRLSNIPFFTYGDMMNLALQETCARGMFCSYPRNNCDGRVCNDLRPPGRNASCLNGSYVFAVWEQPGFSVIG
jgi:hypothetical protein